MPKPIFIIKLHFQKRDETYKDILTDDILCDVCKKITGQTEFSVQFDEEGYNKGRLAKLIYGDTVHYISFS